MTERYTEITDLSDDDNFVYDHLENRKITYEEVIELLNQQDRKLRLKHFDELFGVV
jgi:hypothetical protein